MFSLKEKQEIAAQIEKLLLALNHPEMPKEKPLFQLHIRGKENWSWADVSPNWMFSEKNPPNVNPWNESARELLNHDPK